MSMTALSRLAQHPPPLVAILRGIEPDEVIDTGRALFDAGVRIVEVPLNSPRALQSIELLAAALGKDMLVGAGTVLTVASVDDAAGAGAQFIVSPNTDSAVIAQTLMHRLDAMPGALTPTEALAAVAAGARQLKLFPAGSVSSGHIHALRDVLPCNCPIWAVGGVSAANLAQWIERGAFGVGVGGSLYRPGRRPREVYKLAAEMVGLLECR